MRNFLLSTLPLLACVIAAVLGMDIMDEVAGEWKMGLRPRQARSSLQPFTEALGGASAAPITNSGNTDRPFQVEGDTFTDFNSAGDRVCDNQKNDCAQIANSGGGDFEVNDCDQQATKCKESVKSATETTFNALVSSDDNFDYFCDL